MLIEKILFFHSTLLLIPSLNLIYKTAKIDVAKSIKFLGIYMDNKLDFKVHIKRLENKLSRSVFSSNLYFTQDMLCFYSHPLIMHWLSQQPVSGYNITIVIIITVFLFYYYYSYFIYLFIFSFFLVSNRHCFVLPFCTFR